MEDVAKKHPGAVFSGHLYASDFDHYDDDILFSFENGILKIGYKILGSLSFSPEDIIRHCKADFPEVDSLDFSLPFSDETKSCVGDFLKHYNLVLEEWEDHPVIR